MKSILVSIFILLSSVLGFAQTGGVTGKSTGVALQQTSPGNDQTGSWHVNGTGIADFELGCWGPRYPLNGNNSSLWYGFNQSYPQNDIDFFSVHIGSNHHVNTAGQTQQYNVTLGNQITVYGSWATALGYGCTVGDSNSPGAFGGCIAIGHGTTATGNGSISIGGLNTTDTIIGNAQNDGNILIGNQNYASNGISHGGNWWGGNVSIGNLLNYTDCVNMVVIDSRTIDGGTVYKAFTNTDSNSVQIGNASHTTVKIAGVDATPVVNTSWVPTFTGLTVVPGTGGATYSGGYVRDGNSVNWWGRISVTGTCTVESLLGTTFITNPPFATAHIASMTAVTTTYAGTGYTSSVHISTPTWSPRNENVNMNGVIFLQ